MSIYNGVTQGDNLYHPFHNVGYLIKQDTARVESISYYGILEVFGVRTERVWENKLTPQSYKVPLASTVNIDCDRLPFREKESALKRHLNPLKCVIDLVNPLRPPSFFSANKPIRPAQVLN